MAAFTAKRDGIDVNGHEITVGMDVQGYAKQEQVDGKSKRVWYLDCSWCVANQPNASKPRTKPTAARNHNISPEDDRYVPAKAAKPSKAAAAKQPSLGSVSEAAMVESLVAFGARMQNAFNKQLADTLAKLPKQMTIGEIEQQIIARNSLAQAFGLGKSKTISNPNGTGHCPATKADGTPCTTLVKAGSHCGPHAKQAAKQAAPADEPAQAAPKTADEIAAEAFAAVEGDSIPV